MSAWDESSQHETEVRTKMAKSDIYRTVLTLEVFSEGPLPDTDLADWYYIVNEGECIGQATQDDSERVPAAMVRDHLLRIGNDGTFFGEMDEK